MKQFLRWVLLLPILLAGFPAGATGVYVFRDYGNEYVTVQPNLITADFGPLSFDLTTLPGAYGYISLLNNYFDPKNALVVIDQHTSTRLAFPLGAFATPGHYVSGLNSLTVLDLQTYTTGSVLYLMDTRIGVFGYVAPHFLTGDTGFMPLFSCMDTAPFACGDVSFDVGEDAGHVDAASVQLSDPEGLGFTANLRFPHGAFGGAGIYAGENGSLLTVVALPGGAEPPAAGVPEPAIWMTMIAGFALVGAMARRARAAHTQVNFGRGSRLP